MVGLDPRGLQQHSQWRAWSEDAVESVGKVFVFGFVVPDEHNDVLELRGKLLRGLVDCSERRGLAPGFADLLCEVPLVMTLPTWQKDGSAELDDGVRLGCAGFGKALDVARLYIERGQYRTAVVIGSEAISRLIVPLCLGKDPDRIRMRDRMNPYNFGDGAGVVVVRAGADGRGIIGSAMACVGGNKKSACRSSAPAPTSLSTSSCRPSGWST